MDYDFLLPITVSPSNDTIALGDTLWLEISADNPMLNSRSGKYYDVSNADFMLRYNYNDIMLPIADENGGYFVVDEAGIPYTNNHPDGDLSKRIKFRIDEAGKLYWKQGLVVSRRGLFLISFATSANIEATRLRVTDCPKESIWLTYTYQNQSTNFYLLQNSLDANIRNWQEDAFNKFGAYVVYID